MDSFIITPSILLHMLHILYDMHEQPDGNNQVKHGLWMWVILPFGGLLHRQQASFSLRRKEWENQCKRDII